MAEIEAREKKVIRVEKFQIKNGPSWWDFLLSYKEVVRGERRCVTFQCEGIGVVEAIIIGMRRGADLETHEFTARPTRGWRKHDTYYNFHHLLTLRGTFSFDSRKGELEITEWDHWLLADEY